MAEYRIREDSPFNELVDKTALFKSLFEQVDSACARIQLSHPRGKEKWRQVRKVASEYMGNLYKHKTKAHRAWFDLAWSGNSLTFKICHDGEAFDQTSKVETIRVGLQFLKATPKTFTGTSHYDGVQFEISFEDGEVV